MTENEPKYRLPVMPPTPDGNTVRKVSGDWATISARAAQIKDLGEKMTMAANTLDLFADGTLGKGLSLDAIREQAKEVHDDLATAGERYTPSGDALAAYAAALRTVQDETDSLVDNSGSSWEEVNSASYALMAVQQDQADFDANPPATESEATVEDRPDSSAEQAAFELAVSTWEGYWSQYDAPFETWDDAYAEARDSLEEVNENGVEDGFWDNAMPFVEGVITVMTWVGVIALVVAVVLTGPIAAVAAAVMIVASLVVLAAEASKFLADRGSGRDLALAIVGVVPFGKLTKLSRLGEEFPQALKAMDSTAQRMFDISPTAWTRTHGLNTRNMLRTFSLFKMQRNSRTGALDALSGLRPGEVPANLADALAAYSQGLANTLVGAGGVNSLAGGSN